MKKIEAELKRADHLLFVSMKYTKTCDVIKNVIKRWVAVIDLSVDRLLSRAKRKKIIGAIPTAPIAKTNLLLTTHKDPIVREIIEMYLFFRRIDSMEQIRTNEFRKNVALIVINSNKETTIDIPKLNEWNSKLESFIKYVAEKL